jgi:hypothetical protein
MSQKELIHLDNFPFVGKRKYVAGSNMIQITLA